ncbi:4Fe-4S binding protein [Clostridium aminobutyricum]|uniref:4Fe-4S binding protein n=1 Tax=Clostridium aminobutyricum TaxID=33953 RepID=A0A939D8L3_CLOAM|nr:4Fe-4S binding protein [Clostridium aminobutyricum]MBN7772713.1 4Fe-4S binding protein [Clostridium aminobutyricum]
MKKAAEINERTPWQELAPGAEIYEPATSKLVNTGDWRTMVPIFLDERCKHCLICVPYCPDSSIPVKDGKRGELDLMHCKGCGICYKVCPFEAIEFIKEDK